MLAVRFIPAPLMTEFRIRAAATADEPDGSGDHRHHLGRRDNSSRLGVLAPQSLGPAATYVENAAVGNRRGTAMIFVTTTDVGAQCESWGRTFCGPMPEEI